MPALGLNTATIRQAALLEQIRATSEAGFAGIGLWLKDIDAFVAAGGTLERVRETLAAARLQPVELCFVGGWMYTLGGEKARSLREARRHFEAARALGCHCALAVPSNQEGTVAAAARDFAELCDLAAECDVRVALEANGLARTVCDLATVLEIVETADRPSGGLLFDSFHFYLGGSKLEDIGRIPLGKLFLVHLSDAEDVPPQQLREFHQHRVFPGEGIFDIASVVTPLLKLGYDGFFCTEVFNEDYLRQEPAELARRGRAALERVISEAGKGDLPRRG